jgi:hypothetical protein
MQRVQLNQPSTHLRKERRSAMLDVWRPILKRVGVMKLAELQSQRRFLLWIDAVGGFLVCPGDRVVLGQALPGADIDVPILADVSRRHAAIVREGGEYLIEPSGSVRLNGRTIVESAPLTDGDEIQLGEGVRIRFRKPHPLSASARLDFLGRHRPQPAPDGVLLMAESCVLGPRTANHVVCPHWSDDVVLFRQQDKLHCRTGGKVEIDGRLYNGRGPITENSHITGDDFSLSLEEM